MDDLISRKAVLDIILGELGFRCGYDADIALLSVKKCVSELPTAYDPDAVVEQICGCDGCSGCCNCYEEERMMECEEYVRVYEIVRKGGVHE